MANTLAEGGGGSWQLQRRRRFRARRIGVALNHLMGKSKVNNGL